MLTNHPGLWLIFFGILIYFLLISLGTGLFTIEVFLERRSTRKANRNGPHVGQRNIANIPANIESKALRQPVGVERNRKTKLAMPYRITLSGIGSGIGIITGIAGIAQGVNPHDMPRTLIALAIGAAGLLGVYLLALKR
jgi:hypothetical protein